MGYATLHHQNRINEHIKQADRIFSRHYLLANPACCLSFKEKFEVSVCQARPMMRVENQYAWLEGSTIDSGARSQGSVASFQ